MRCWYKAPDDTIPGESRNMAEPTPTADTRYVDRATSCLCPWWEWEPRKGSWSTQGGYHPPYEEQSLAARSTWVSAQAMRNVPCPWSQAWPPGTPLPPEMLIQTPPWDSARVPPLCCGQGPTPSRPLWLLCYQVGTTGRKACLGTGRQGPNFSTSTKGILPTKTNKQKCTAGSR